MPLHLLLLLLLLPSAAVAGKARQSSSFALDFFPGDGAVAQLALTGANATSAGDISMRSPRARVQYHKPIHFAPAAAGFSTYFSFSLHPSPKSHAASLAFFLTPAAPSSPSPAVNALAVVFAAADSSHIRVQIDLAGETAAQTAPRAIPKKVHSWIDYNATSAMLQVRLSASRLPKPPRALLSHPLHLDSALRSSSKPMLAGFASSHANCSLFSWAFRANHGPPYLMHSQPLDPTGLSLTTPPPDRLPCAPPGNRYPWVSLLLAAACGAVFTFVVLFVWYTMGKRRPVAPVEYPMHPSSSDIVYEKIVLVGVKDLPADVTAAAHK